MTVKKGCILTNIKAKKAKCFIITFRQSFFGNKKVLLRISNLRQHALGRFLQQHKKVLACRTSAHCHKKHCFQDLLSNTIISTVTTNKYRTAKPLAMRYAFICTLKPFVATFSDILLQYLLHICQCQTTLQL